jgi:hypothetical protein
MATNSTVSNNESDSTITIINDDYSLVIKEFLFLEYYAFDINASYFKATVMFSPATALETRTQKSPYLLTSDNQLNGKEGRNDKL